MYTIGQTTEKLGIKVSTLRYYEEVMLLNKRIGLVVLAMLLGSMVTGCQSRMKPGDTTGTITRETAVVENQLSNGILIAYVPDTAQAFEVEGEEGQSDNTVGPMDEVVHMIEEVTDGISVSIGGEDSLPKDYGTVFLGITGQTSELPEVLRTFVEEHDFSGKTIIPFLVADGGNLEDMRDTLYELEPEAEFLDGISINVNDSGDQQPKVNEWLSDLGYNN